MGKSKKPRKKMSARKGVNPAQLTLAKAQYSGHYKGGRFAEALAVVQRLIGAGVRDSNVFSDAAVACVYLERWEAAMDYAARSLALNCENLSALDAMSHAAGALRKWDVVAEHGLRALKARDAMVPAASPLELPLAPRAEGATRRVIAFSLFGGNSKYCETAILNAEEQPRLYPGWICRFFVDETVPEAIVDRLRGAGAEVDFVDADMASWPGPMWRFAAYDDPDLSHVIFRDADSVISEREAGAVAEWLESGEAFHAMRDAGTHSELLLAGLWGVRRGALPEMRAMMAHFVSEGVDNAHFADQFFLRAHVWPYARRDIRHHDALFGFMGGGAFPDGPHRDDFHVGYAEGSPYLTVTSSLPDGAEVSWYLLDLEAEPHREVCRYVGRIADGALIAHVPARYALKVQSDAMRIGVDAA